MKQIQERSLTNYLQVLNKPKTKNLERN